MKEYRYIIKDMQGDEDFATTKDCVDLMQSFNQPCDYASEEEDRAILEGHWHQLHIGTDDDHYEIKRLDEVRVEDSYGEIVPRSELWDAGKEMRDHMHDLADEDRRLCGC